MAESDFMSEFKSVLNDLSDDQLRPVIRGIISGLINYVDPASDILSDAGLVVCAYRAVAENNEEVKNLLDSTDNPAPDFIDESYAHGMLDCAKMAVVRIIENEMKKNGHELDLKISRGLFLVVSDIAEEFTNHLYANLPDYVTVKE